MPRMSRFDWIIVAGAMMIAGYESMSLIGGVAEFLSAQREASVERSLLDIQLRPNVLDNIAEGSIRQFGITRISEAEYTISSTADSWTSNVDDLRWQARIKPSFRNGKCDGLRLVGITSDSIYAALGFRSGDVVHYINGFALNGSDSAPMVYQHVRDAAYLDVEFERRGVALRRRYWLR